MSEHHADRGTSLHRYITNRDELVDLVVDAAQGEDPLPEPTRNWRAGLAAQALGAVHAYVLGSVATQQALRRAEQRTGLTEEQWQHSVGPYISEVLAARCGR